MDRAMSGWKRVVRMEWAMSESEFRKGKER